MRPKHKQPAAEERAPVAQDLAPALHAIMKTAVEETLKDLYHEVWALLRYEFAGALERMFPDPESDRRRAVGNAALASLLEAAEKPGSRAPSHKAIKAAYAAAEKRLGPKPPPKAKANATAPPSDNQHAKACNVSGCDRPHRTRGYCGAHYQAARKYGWPMPCPLGFKAPAVKRGGTARAKAAKKAEGREAGGGAAPASTQPPGRPRRIRYVTFLDQNIRRGTGFRESPEAKADPASWFGDRPDSPAPCTIHTVRIQGRPLAPRLTRSRSAL